MLSPSRENRVIHTTAVPRTIPLLLAILLCSCLLVVAPALAQRTSPGRRGHRGRPVPSPSRDGSSAPEGETALAPAARVHVQSGNAYFQVGDYEHALRELQKAYDLSRRPGLQYNIALCYDRLGQPGLAAQHLRRFLSDASPGAIRNRAALEMRAQILERRARRDVIGTQGHGGSPRTHRPLRVVAPSGGIPTGALVSYIVGGVGVAAFGVFGSLALLEDNQSRDPVRCQLQRGRGLIAPPLGHARGDQPRRRHRGRGDRHDPALDGPPRPREQHQPPLGAPVALVPQGRRRPAQRREVLTSPAA